MKSNKCKLGDIITQRREKNTGENLPICGVTREGFIPPKQKDADTSLYNVFYKKDFVFNPARMELNSIVYNNVYEKAICSSLYEVFYVNRPDIVLPEFLALIVKQNWFTRYCEFLGSGSAREYCRVANISQIEINYPSLEEQRKIVKAYQTIADRIALKRKINEDLVASLSTVYKELFSDAETQYSKVPLQKICTKIGSGATPKGGKTAYIDEGISLIRSTNVFDFRFEYSDLAHINQTQADALSSVTVEPNDVLFNITGVSVARCCMVPDDVLPARVNQHVMIVRPAKGIAMSYYIMFTLCSASNKAKLLGIGQSGSTREAINKQELESFEIPIPDDDSLNKFGEIALCAYKNIQCNVKEIRLLEDMKSVLLAQLSSH